MKTKDSAVTKWRRWHKLKHRGTRRFIIALLIVSVFFAVMMTIALFITLVRK